MIFVNSMSDLFHPNVPTEFIDDVFAVMADTPRHTFQLLTKRSKRMVDLADRLTWPLNLWVGVSIESDPYSYRANHLRRVPSAVRFVSAEPLLGPLPSLNLTQVDWLIAGGESGHHSRPMHPEWARDLRDRCRDANVAFFFKQWGSWAPADGPTTVTVAFDGSTRLNSDPELADTAVRMRRVSRVTAGRVLDGNTWDQLPEP
jgi:protein gp37